MSKSKGYIGSKVMTTMIVTSALIIGSVLIAISLSQPIDPEVEVLVKLPERRESAISGFVGALNITGSTILDVASVFNITGTPVDEGNMWMVKNGSKSIMTMRPRDLVFSDLWFKCNISNARPRSDFPDPMVVLDDLLSKLIDKGVFPNYNRTLVSVNETIEPGSKMVCLLAIRISLSRDGIPMNAPVTLNFDHDGNAIDFRSSAFGFSNEGYVKVKDPQHALQRVARSMAHDSWGGREHVSKLIVQNMTLRYTYPSSGWKVILEYLVVYDAIYTTGEQKHWHAHVIAT